MPDPSPSHEEFCSFLSAWGPAVLVAIFHNRKKRKPIEAFRYEVGSEEAAWAWASRLNGEKWGIYFHVGSTRAGFCGKATKADITDVRWLHVDVDPRTGEDLGTEQERILDALRGYSPPPTMIVFSGRGYQGYWKLSGPASHDVAERCNRAIEIALGGDCCHDVCRVMRCPGLINYPDERKAKGGAVPTMARRVA